MAETAQKVLWDVMEEHLEEACFLWTQWEAALDAPDYTVGELAAREEQRLAAHLDALVLGGDAVAEELLLPALTRGEAETAVAAGLALTAADRGDAVLEALGAVDELTPGALGLRRALELCALARVEQGLRGVAGGQGAPLSRALALEALAFHGADVGTLPADLTANEDPAVTRAMLRAARAAAVVPAGLVQRALEGEDPGLRITALRTGVLRGVEGARQRCSGMASQPGGRGALELEALLGGAAALPLLQAALESPATRLDALWALGFCGTPEAAEQCVDAMASGDELQAAVAAEALCAITGLDLQAASLVRPPEPAEESDDVEGGFTLAMSPEAYLPRPDAEGVAAWWAARRVELPPGERRIFGRPVGLAGLAGALSAGTMWRRHGLAMELSTRGEGHAQLRVQTRTWCAVQRRQVDALAQLDEQDLDPGPDWGTR